MSDIKLTDEQAERLLAEIYTPEEPIVPLTDAEVAEIEAAYDGHQIDPAQDARQRAAFEEMRQEWMRQQAEEIAAIAEKLIIDAYPLQEQFNPESYEVSGELIMRLSNALHKEPPDDLDGEPGVVLEYHDAPEDEIEDEDKILVDSGILPELIKAATATSPSGKSWEQELRAIGEPDTPEITDSQMLDWLENQRSYIGGWTLVGVAVNGKTLRETIKELMSNA